MSLPFPTTAFDQRKNAESNLMRYTGPKNRVSRRFGQDLGLKSSKASTKLARRLNIPPGQHGPKGTRRMTGYGEHLIEKQKLKFTYGISENQLHRIFTVASKVKQATGEALLSLLERRLDNVVYRLNFAPTRASARQLVSHGHILVNQKKVNIPSFRVKSEDLITIDSKGMKIPATVDSLENSTSKTPEWIERKAAVGKIKSLPKREEIDISVNDQLIVEYYSR